MRLAVLEFKFWCGSDSHWFEFQIGRLLPLRIVREVVLAPDVLTAAHQHRTRAIVATVFEVRLLVVARELLRVLEVAALSAAAVLHRQALR